MLSNIEALVLGFIHDHNLSLSNVPMYGVAWVIFFAAGLTSYGYQYYLVRKDLSFFGFLKHCFPIHSWRQQSSYVDIILYIVSKYTRGIVMIGHMALIIAVASGVAQLLSLVLPSHVALKAGLLTIILFSIFILVVWDFSAFFSHWLQHKVPFLWEIHKVHHSATELNLFTSKRLHPLADKLDLMIGGTLMGLVFGIGTFIYGFTVPDMVFMLGNVSMLATIMFLDSLRHSQFSVSFGPLEKVFVSPFMHHLHHSVKLEHWDKNMGYLLSIWDQMFGTYYIPQKGETFVYGIGRGAAVDLEYQSLYGAYIHPVVKSVKVLTGIQKPEPMPVPGMALEPASAMVTEGLLAERIEKFTSTPKPRRRKATSLA